LKQLINQRGRLAIDKAIPLMIQACAGIGYAHRAGLVHCDVKPQNIMVTPDQRLKVTDFGIARALASIHADEQSDVVWGSPQYFSPEQATGQPPSPASDVYSLGIILYEVTTGRLPFIGKTSDELSRLHREAPIPSPRRYNPAINENLNRIILKVLAKEPSARYRTADQLGRVLITFAPKDKTPVLETQPQAPPPHQYQEPISQPVAQPVQKPKAQTPAINPFDMDWITITLGFIAFLAVGGLIPFWVWVYFSISTN